MRKPESYWNSDDEDEGPRTYRNVRPSAVGIEHGGGHNHTSSMHRDYVASRQVMTQIEQEIQYSILAIQEYQEKLLDEDSNPHYFYDKIQEVERNLRILRRQWSFYANNYHTYDDVGAQTQFAIDAYDAHMHGL